MQKHFLPGMLVAALGFAGPWASAQTAQTPPMTPSGADAQPGPGGRAGPGKPSATDQTQPLKNPLNRNPARRSQLPAAAPPPPDPRDSTTRPVMPPGNDGRDAVLPAPVATQLPGSTPTTPALGKP